MRAKTLRRMRSNLLESGTEPIKYKEKPDVLPLYVIDLLGTFIVLIALWVLCIGVLVFEVLTK